MERFEGGNSRDCFGGGSGMKTGVSIQGTVRNGVVVLPPDAKLPEGAQVQQAGFKALLA